MEMSHRARVEALLANAAAEYAAMLGTLPSDLQASLPVDAQGVTRAIDQLADATGMTVSERHALIRPHAVNPAVMHARVYGRAPLGRATVVASFVDGARVRAEALLALADRVGAGERVRAILVASPPPVEAGSDDAGDALRATYAAHERAAVTIAAALDAQ